MGAQRVKAKTLAHVGPGLAAGWELQVPMRLLGSPYSVLRTRLLRRHTCFASTCSSQTLHCLVAATLSGPCRCCLWLAVVAAIPSLNEIQMPQQVSEGLEAAKAPQPAVSGARLGPYVCTFLDKARHLEETAEAYFHLMGLCPNQSSSGSSMPTRDSQCRIRYPTSQCPSLAICSSQASPTLASLLSIEIPSSGKL